MHDDNVCLGQSFINDICISEINPFYISKIGVEETQGWFERNLSADPIEIARRNSQILALINQAEVQSALKMQVEAARAVKRIKQAFPAQPVKLVHYAMCFKTLHLFIQSVEKLRGHFTGQNDILQALFSPVLSCLDSHEYADARAHLQQAKDLLSLPTDITIGVNISEGGESLQMCLMDLNQWTGKVCSLFDAQAENPNSLFGPVPFRERREIVHMEAFLYAAIEKELGSSLTRAMNRLSPFPDDLIDRWLLWVEGLEPILAGLSFATALQKKGFPLCVPACDGGAAISARELYSAHMALCGSQKPFPFDVNAERAALTLVTGANQSGKTSFIRTIAQSLLFAQLGFLLPAKQFSFTPHKRFLSLYAAGESLTSSRFEQEARIMNELLSMADRSTMVFLNEPFTSTNPSEAEPLLAESILRLAETGATTFVVTHLYDLYEPLREVMGSRLQSLVTRSRADACGCAYWVEKRPPDGVSYAREIARTYGLTVRELVKSEALSETVEAFLPTNKRSIEYQ